MKIIKEVLSYAIIIAIVLLIRFYVFSLIKVNGSSMYPTLHDNDIMFLNEFSYHFEDIKRFDIVVVDIKTEKIIKRVIGLPGEKVSFKDNILYINGEEVLEEFSHDITHNFDLSEIDEEIIPEGYYFVCGDNRGDSLDSRKLGLIKRKQIMGKANTILFPFSRISNVK